MKINLNDNFFVNFYLFESVNMMSFLCFKYICSDDYLLFI